MDGWTPELNITRDVWFQEINRIISTERKNANCGMCRDCLRDNDIKYSDQKHHNYNELRQHI